MIARNSNDEDLPCHLFFAVPETENPGYFSSFMTWTVVGTMLMFFGYVVMVRKQRVLAFLVEGRKPRRSGGGRGARLFPEDDSTLSDIMPMLKAA
jgi:hypothetical protein